MIDHACGAVKPSHPAHEQNGKPGHGTNGTATKGEPNCLTPEQLADLDKSGINHETIRAAGLRSVQGDEASRLLG